MTVTSPLDELLKSMPDEDEKPLTEADLKMIRDLDLTSCDFVGDSGCCDEHCWRCHSPLRPENLRTFAKNLGTAAMLCRAWKMRDEDPSWRPGCQLGRAAETS